MTVMESCPLAEWHETIVDNHRRKTLVKKTHDHQLRVKWATDFRGEVRWSVVDCRRLVADDHSTMVRRLAARLVDHLPR